MNECADICVHSALQWTGVPSSVEMMGTCIHCAWNRLWIHYDPDRYKVVTKFMIYAKELTSEHNLIIMALDICGLGALGSGVQQCCLGFALTNSGH